MPKTLIQKNTANGRLVEVKDGRFTFCVSNSAPDRDSDTVDQESLDWSEFDQNPVATLSHDTEVIPVGKWVPESRRLAKVNDPSTGQQVLGTLMDFIPNPHTQAGKEVALSVKDDFLGGSSISFLPDEEKSQKNNSGGSHYEGAKVTEVAVCAVPANQGATRRAAMLCKSLKRSKDMNKSVQHRVFQTEREAQAFKDNLRRQGVRASVHILGNATTAHEAEGNRRVVEWEEEDLGIDNAKTHKGKSMSIKLWRNKSDATHIRILRKDLQAYAKIISKGLMLIDPKHPIGKREGGWVIIDSASGRVVQGPFGNDEALARSIYRQLTKKAEKDAPSAESQVDDEAAGQSNYDGEGVGTTGNVPPEVNLELMDDTSKVEGDEDWVEEEMKSGNPEQEGEQAATSGKPESSNPYPRGSDEYEDWVYGYRGIKLPGTKAEDYADSTANRAQEMDLDSADEMMAIDAAMEEEQVPQAMRGAVKALASKRLKSLKEKAKLNVGDSVKYSSSWVRSVQGGKEISDLRGTVTEVKPGPPFERAKIRWSDGQESSSNTANLQRASLGSKSKSTTKAKADDATDDKDCGDMPGYKYLKAAIDHLQSNMKSIEHKDVLAAAQKALAALTGGMSKAYGKDAYPGDQQEVIEGEGDEAEDTLMSKEQTPVEVEGVWTIYDPTTDEYVGEFASEEEASRGITDMAKPSDDGQEQMSKGMKYRWDIFAEGASSNFAHRATVYADTKEEAIRDAKRQLGSDEKLRAEMSRNQTEPRPTHGPAQFSKGWKRTKANRHLIVKGLNKAQKSTIGDAVEFMEGCSESKDMPKHLKSGHKHHALSLKSMLESKQDDMEPQMSKEAEEEMTLALQKVLQKQEEFDKGMKRKFGQQWEKVGQENGNRLQWDN